MVWWLLAQGCDDGWIVHETRDPATDAVSQQAVLKSGPDQLALSCRSGVPIEELVVTIAGKRTCARPVTMQLDEAAPRVVDPSSHGRPDTHVFALDRALGEAVLGAHRLRIRCDEVTAAFDLADVRAVVDRVVAAGGCSLPGR